ncbi:hypothetical protein SAMN04488689_103571 [Paenibacillus sp. cl6col]|nr:hypothetical protein SAMN04488689_103571 [Paenibacillus sp. cl6col]
MKFFKKLYSQSFLCTLVFITSTVVVLSGGQGGIHPW